MAREKPGSDLLDRETHTAPELAGAGPVAGFTSAFTQPLFRVYFPSSCLATLGSWFIRFLFGWLAWELTQSAFFVGSVACAMLVPTFLLSPLFGIAADRIDTHRGLLATTGLQAFVSALAGALAFAGLLNEHSVLLLALLFGAIMSAHTPIRLAFIPRLVVREALPSAVGYSAVAFNSSRILGPALGAALLAATNVTATFFVGGLASLLAHLLLWRVRVSPPEQDFAQHGDALFRQLRAGFVYLIRQRTIRWVFLLTLTSGFLGRTALELLPALSGTLLAGDASTLATLTAMAGAGSIVGGLLVSRQASRLRRLYQLVVVSLATAAALLMTLSQWDSLVLAGVAIALLSLCTTIIGTSCQSLVQLLVSEQFRGRVLSLWTVVGMGAPAIGALLFGTAGDRFGLSTVLAIPAVVCFGVLFAAIVARVGEEIGD
ncbi:MAG: MFS transporter [Pseudomonadota bacterium]